MFSPLNITYSSNPHVGGKYTSSLWKVAWNGKYPSEVQVFKLDLSYSTATTRFFSIRCDLVLNSYQVARYWREWTLKIVKYFGCFTTYCLLKVRIIAAYCVSAFGSKLRFSCNGLWEHMRSTATVIKNICWNSDLSSKALTHKTVLKMSASSPHGQYNRLYFIGTLLHRKSLFDLIKQT